MRRVGDHVGGCAGLNDHAPVHEDQAVADLPGEADLVGDHDHGHARSSQILHHVEYLADQLRIQSARRFVEEHQLGLHRQRPGDGHPLLLSAGQLGRIAVQLIRQADPVEQGPRLFAGMRPAVAANPAVIAVAVASEPRSRTRAGAGPVPGCRKVAR